MVAQQGALLPGVQRHPGVRRWRVARLVLDGQPAHRDAGVEVGARRPDQVVRVGAGVLRAQRPADQRAAGLHEAGALHGLSTTASDGASRGGLGEQRQHVVLVDGPG